ncbi:Ig-like domain repeat protein, partial [Cellulomonas septica]|nr:Ig-like domain repeat protein [Cellulomonas septica]
MLRPSLPRRLRAVATTAALVLAAAVGVSAPASAVPDGYPIADVPATGSVQTNIPVTVVCPFVEDQPWTIASWVTSEGSGILKTAHGTLADAQMVYSGSVWFSSPAPTGYVDVRCGYEDGDGRETWVSSGRFPISVAAPVVATTTTVAVAPSVTLPATLPATATVATSGGAVTTGSVQFSVDGVDVGAPVAVDAHGEARTDLGAPAPGHRSVSARYLGASGSARTASATCGRRSATATCCASPSASRACTGCAPTTTSPVPSGSRRRPPPRSSGATSTTSSSARPATSCCSTPRTSPTRSSGSRRADVRPGPARTGLGV